MLQSPLTLEQTKSSPHAQREQKKSQSFQCHHTDPGIGRYGLKVKCAPKAHVFEYQVPRWWLCLGKMWKLEEMKTHWRNLEAGWWSQRWEVPLLWSHEFWFWVCFDASKVYPRSWSCPAMTSWFFPKTLVTINPSSRKLCLSVIWSQRWKDN